MHEPLRIAVWEAYFDAEWRCRFFVRLADKKKRHLRRLSIAIAMLSCGPLATIAAETQLGTAFGVFAGALAGILGVYIASSGLLSEMATAKRAAAAWNAASIKLRTLWSRVQSGEDVTVDLNNIDLSLLGIDDAVIETLEIDQHDVELADQDARRALGAV